MLLLEIFFVYFFLFFVKKIVYDYINDYKIILFFSFLFFFLCDFMLCLLLFLPTPFSFCGALGVSHHKIYINFFLAIIKNFFILNFINFFILNFINFCALIEWFDFFYLLSHLSIYNYYACLGLIVFMIVIFSVLIENWLDKVHDNTAKNVEAYELKKFKNSISTVLYIRCIKDIFIHTANDLLKIYYLWPTVLLNIARKFFYLSFIMFFIMFFIIFFSKIDSNFYVVVKVLFAKFLFYKFVISFLHVVLLLFKILFVFCTVILAINLQFFVIFFSRLVNNEFLYILKEADFFFKKLITLIFSGFKEYLQLFFLKIFDITEYNAYIFSNIEEFLFLFLFFIFNLLSFVLFKYYANSCLAVVPGERAIDDPNWTLANTLPTLLVNINFASKKHYELFMSDLLRIIQSKQASRSLACCYYDAEFRIKVFYCIKYVYLQRCRDIVLHEGLIDYKQLGLVEVFPMLTNTAIVPEYRKEGGDFKLNLWYLGYYVDCRFFRDCSFLNVEDYELNMVLNSVDKVLQFNIFFRFSQSFQTPGNCAMPRSASKNPIVLSFPYEYCNQIRFKSSFFFELKKANRYYECQVAILLDMRKQRIEQEKRFKVLRLKMLVVLKNNTEDKNGVVIRRCSQVVRQRPLKL